MINQTLKTIRRTCYLVTLPTFLICIAGSFAYMTLNELGIRGLNSRINNIVITAFIEFLLSVLVSELIELYETELIKREYLEWRRKNLSSKD